MTGQKVEPQEAQKRAIEDYSQSSQFARASAQFTFGANGGAAAAILSFLTTTVNSATPTSFNRALIVHNFSIACLFYVLGLLIATASMYLFARSKKLWGDAWEAAAFEGEFRFDAPFPREAQRFENRAWGTLVLSALMLGVGSFFAVRGFFTQ